MTCVVREEYIPPPLASKVVSVVVITPLVSVFVVVPDPVTDGVEVTLVVKVLPAESVVVIAMTIGMIGPDGGVGRKALTPDSRAAI